MSARIGVIGSNMVDLVTYVGRMPDAGETLEAPRFEMGAGGKGANQAVAAAKLGSEVLMVSCVGDDLFGGNTRRNFTELGIDARHVRIVPGLSSGVAPIFVEPNGENRILIVKGANDALGPEDVEAAAADLRACALILLQLEVPLETVYHAIGWARRNNKQVLLNPAPATTELSIERIAGVTFFAPNQTELAILTGLPTGTPAEAERAARSLLARGIGSVIVTLGADGALLVEPDRTAAIAPVPVQARDTTGAGDAFIGAFAHHYAAGQDRLGALQQAARYAADAVTRPGTQKSFATAEGFAAFCRDLDPADTAPP
jgi:ribokinase